MYSAYTLFYKELMRFWKVSFQTITAPVITTLLYLIVFGNAMANRMSVFPGVDYTNFLMPGLMMMSMMQNAFANSSSSLIQSKLTGNLIFILLSPLGPGALFFGYIFSSIFRGLCVGLAMFFATMFFTKTSIFSIYYVILFAFLGSLFMASFGMIAGILSEKFDHLALFQSFIVMPLTFLAGTFYSTRGLPHIACQASRLNPIFYMVDGFRHAFLGHSDVPLKNSIIFAILTCVITMIFNLVLLHSGYKLRR